MGVGVACPSRGGAGSQAVGDGGLPREPEVHLLRGHKSRITKVVTHPTY
jgi:hypothetical protein